jgi:hypothetical protein
MRRASCFGLALLVLVLPEAAAWAQTTSYDDVGQKPIGRIHNANRAALRREQYSIGQEVDHAHKQYSAMKKEIEDTTGVTFSMESSVMSQWGTPNGGYGAVQAMFTPAVNWDMFSSPRFGDGSLQFHFMAAQYLSGNSGQTLAENINVNSPINNQPTANNQFVQLTYTHSFPGDWLSISAGQYALSNFDGNDYANDQQTSFIGYAFTQNGSQNYSQAGLGAYAQIDPVKTLTFAAGFQDPNDFSGSYIQFPTLLAGQYSWFLYGAWSPTIAGGQGTYSLLYYNQPSVPLQPVAGQGLSFSASQPVGDKWGLFLRANTAWHSSFQIQSSIAGGAVYIDPLKRHPDDRIGLALAWNATNMALYQGTFVRPSETMMEFFWAFTAFRSLLITPSVQLFLEPALAPTADISAVFSLRLTQLF